VRDRHVAAIKAWKTIRQTEAWKKAHAAEGASKRAFRKYCREHGWRVAFFEGPTGAPRTGIVDAVAFRIDSQNADLLDVRLVQLKGGKAGVSAHEITRLKEAVENAKVGWLVAELDDRTLHLLPEEPSV